MVRSGLQGDVISLYRQGIRNAMSKPVDMRPSFLLHLRYSFRNPELRQRDYTAIEHQLRKMTRTLEMLSEPSVQRISVSSEMEQWWQDEIHRNRSASTSGSTTHSDRLDQMKAGQKDVRERGDSAKDEAQWGHTLPGHGGT